MNKKKCVDCGHVATHFRGDRFCLSVQLGVEREVNRNLRDRLNNRVIKIPVVVRVTGWVPFKNSPQLGLFRTTPSFTKTKTWKSRYKGHKMVQATMLVFVDEVYHG